MGPFPARKSIGAETRVDNGNRGFHQWIAKIRDKTSPPAGHEHAFIDQRAAGHAGDIEKIPAGKTGITNRVLGTPTNDIEFAFEREFIARFSLRGR